MKAITLTLSLSILMAMTPLGLPRALADGGISEPPDGTEVKSAPLYPNSIEVKAGQGLERLTNDGLDNIKAFYKKTLGPNDGIEPLQGDANETGFTVTYRVRFRDGTKEDQASLRIAKTDTAAMKATAAQYGIPYPLPLVNLQNLVGRFDHTQAEYDKIYSQYQWLRYIQYWEPGKSVEDILMRYQEKVFGVMPKTAPKDKAGDAEKQAAMKQQGKEAKALRDQGDIAGMLALAQQMQATSNQTAAGEMSQQIAAQNMAGMMKDSWNDWTACLKEMAPLAYWTKLSYTGSTTWYRETDFWVEAR